MKAISSLLVACVLPFSFQVMSAVSPPSNCVYGTAIGSDGKGFGIEGPDYVRTGDSNRYKGDYDWNFPPINDVMNFNNSEDGLVGSDSTDTDSNAYLYMTLNNRGAHQAWVISQDSLSCSKKNVYAHLAPTGSTISFSDGAQISATISATIDPIFSRNAVEGDGKADIVYMFDMQQGGGVYESISTHSKSINYTPTYSGFYRVTAQIKDGTFSRTIFLGDAYYTGGIPCPDCGPIY